VLHEDNILIDQANQIGISDVPQFSVSKLSKNIKSLLLSYEGFSISRRAKVYPEVALDLISQKFHFPQQVVMMQNSIFPSANLPYIEIKPVVLNFTQEVIQKLKPPQAENYVEIEPVTSKKLLFFIEESKRYMMYYPIKKSVATHNQYVSDNQKILIPSLIPQGTSSNENL
jgi:hypothetical protein